jgi:beta-1,4-galactosyltransferase 4
MIPTDDADYSAPSMPTMMATRCSQFGYKMPSPNYFGGVVLMKRDHFIRAGGFSNRFWGWGGEDDEFRRQVVGCGLTIQYRDTRYECFDHPRDRRHKDYAANLKVIRAPRATDDGVKHVNFRVVSVESKELYTHTKIDFDR